MNDEEYFAFCMANGDLRIERTAGGQIVIMPPTGLETGYQNSDLSAQLRNWARLDGRGIAPDSQTEYFLPKGAAYAPDASWILKDRLRSFTKREKQRFVHICPDFVVELTSPSDRLKRVKAKMTEWIDNGAQLGWLIDPRRKTAYIYRPGVEPETLAEPLELHGEGPVQGFVLDLRAIWAGL